MDMLINFKDKACQWALKVIPILRRIKECSKFQLCEIHLYYTHQ